MSRFSSVVLTMLLIAGCAQDAPFTAPETSLQSSVEPAPMKIYDESPQDCLKLIPSLSPTSPEITGLVSGWPQRSARLAFVVDESFVDHWGRDWPGVVYDLIVAMNTFYSREINLDIEAIQVDVLAGFDVRDYPPVSMTDRSEAAVQALQVLEDAIAAYRRDFDHIERDSVQILFGADVAGRVSGMANCIGGVGDPSVAFVWGEAHERSLEPTIGPIGWNKDLAAKIAIHEFGHMMGGHHHYSSCAESAIGLGLDDISGVCTIMINDISVGQFHFSSANRLATRTWAEQAEL